MRIGSVYHPKEWNPPSEDRLPTDPCRRFSLVKSETCVCENWKETGIISRRVVIASKIIRTLSFQWHMFLHLQRIPSIESLGTILSIALDVFLWHISIIAMITASSKLMTLAKLICSPSWSCDDHFCSEFVEFVPQRFRFNDHFDIRQFRMERLSCLARLAGEGFMIEFAHLCGRFDFLCCRLNVIYDNEEREDERVSLPFNTDLPCVVVSSIVSDASSIGSLWSLVELDTVQYSSRSIGLKSGKKVRWGSPPTNQLSSGEVPWD